VTGGPPAQVLIAGAGPTGLTAALELTRAGIPVRIVDAAPEPATGSRAIGVNPRTLQILEPAGVSDRLLARGNVLRRLSFRTDEGHTLGRLDFGAAGDDGFMLAIPQAVTERELTAALQDRDVTVERPVAFRGLRPAGSRLACLVEREDGFEEIVVSWLIGADGAGSTVRAVSAIPFPGRTRAEPWAVADVRLASDIDAGEGTMVLGELGGLLVLPLGDDLVRLAATGPDLDDMLPHWLEIRETVWTSSFRIHRRLAPSFGRGRIVLAGDAAHLNSPVGARGMNLGIEDAATLAVALVRHEDMDAWRRRRRLAARRTLRTTDLLTALVTVESETSRRLRDRMLGRVLSLGLAQRLIARRIAVGGGRHRPPPS